MSSTPPPNPPPPDIPGFRAGDCIYVSSISRVYRAVREEDELPVVLKVLNEEFPSPRQVARFRREHEITRSLDLPGTIRTYADPLPYGNTLVLVIEDFGGQSLDRRLAGGVIPVGDFLRLALRMTEILISVHKRNVIHKDISPGNFVWNSATDEIKIIDFGISTVIPRETPRSLHPERLEGTLRYISPEQTGRMNRSVDNRSDLYCLGGTFFHMLSGQPPFESNDPLDLIHAHMARVPPPLHTLNPEIPEVLSDIVARLLAKTPEERYQSAYGLKADLERCVEDWREFGPIRSFVTGQHDVPNRFYFPQRLYGRERESEALKDALGQADDGGCELLLLSGYAGIGKTALVGELQPDVAQRGGYFVSGKFDQFKRNIPYLALLQAIQDFVGQILTQKSDQIEFWKERMLESLGRNGGVVADVVPEVALIVGPQPEARALGSNETQNRFEQVMSDFLLALAAGGKPLVIFLDDLHWADGASLRLIQRVMQAPSAGGLLMIGAYRDQEVDEHHPLTELIDGQKVPGVRTMELAPLNADQINHLVADTVHVPPPDARSLSDLLFEKTRGNPFFTAEFLRSLYRDGLLEFDEDSGRWMWDVVRIGELSIADNVADLMAGSIAKLSPAGQRTIQLAACAGNVVALDTLALVLDLHPGDAAREVEELLESGLVLPIGDDYKYAETEGTGAKEVRYRFLHDRVQQAAYHSMEDTERVETHLMVGRFLRDRKAGPGEDEIFTVVNHLNKGILLIDDHDERIGLAELNLSAGQRARRSAAYQSAGEYLGYALDLLPSGAWRSHPELTLELHLERAEADFMLADYERTDAAVQTVVDHVDDVLVRCRAYEIKVRSLYARGEVRASIYTAIDALGLLGVKIGKTPTLVDVLREFVGLQLLIRRRGFDYPLRTPMRDPRMLAALDILASIGGTSYSLDPNIFALSAFQTVRLSYLYGASPNTPMGLALYGVALTGLHLYGQVDRVSKLGEELLERAEDRAYLTRPTMVFGTIVHWNHPARLILSYMERSIEIAWETGNVEYVGYSALFRGLLGIFVGDNLKAISERLLKDQASLVYYGMIPIDSILRLSGQLVLNLRGESEEPQRLSGELFDSDRLVAGMHEMKFHTGVAIFHFGQAVLYYLFRDYEAARREFVRLKEPEEAITGMRIVPYQKLFQTLTELALARRTRGWRRWRHMRAARGIMRLLKRWARLQPHNNQAMLELARAELERTRGRFEDASDLYENAIRFARQSGFQLDLALSNELAGEFYLEYEKEQIASVYLIEARYAYEHWGAGAKVKQLDGQYPRLLANRRRVSRSGEYASVSVSSSTHSTTDDKGWTLDLNTVIRASRSISREIEIEQLLMKLMRIVVVNSGAQRGLLLLETEGEWRIEAQAGLAEDDIEILEGRPVDETAPLSNGVFNYVLRTGESLLMEDAVHDPRFSGDAHIRSRQQLSLFCLPLLNRKQRVGILYLENDLASGVFIPERLEILHLLSSQIAVAIENARLYSGLQDEIARRNRLERTRRAQSEIIAKLNHELQIPVLGVLANLDTMETAIERGNSGVLPEKIARTRNYCVYLRTLIQNMTFASASEFREPFYVMPEDFAELESCYATAASLVHDIHDGEFEDIVPPKVRVPCQESLLVIVLVNVLGNCAEHSHRFEIDWLFEDHMCTLTCVNDLVAPLDISSIFEKWSSTRRDSTKPILGLGLYIARSILDQIGGEIEATQADGRFYLTVRLPISAQEVEAVRPGSSLLS